MKKIYILLFGILLCLLLSGCDSNTKTLECSKNTTNIKTKYIIKYNDTRVLKSTSETTEYYDSSMYDLIYSVTESTSTVYSSIEGIEYSVQKGSNYSIKSKIVVDYTNFDLDAFKDLFGDESEYIYSSNNISIDDFRENVLNGFICE